MVMVVCLLAGLASCEFVPTHGKKHSSHRISTERTQKFLRDKDAFWSAAPWRRFKLQTANFKLQIAESFLHISCSFMVMPPPVIRSRVVLKSATCNAEFAF
jgi:hypothetical protein